MTPTLDGNPKPASTSQAGVPDSGSVSGPVEAAQVFVLSMRSAVYICVGVLIGIFALNLARNLQDTITRVLLGLTLALALDPVVVRLQRRFRVKRGLAVLMVGFVALLFTGLLTFIVGPRAVNQAQTISRDAPNTINSLSSTPVLGSLLNRAHATDRLHTWANELPAKINDTAIADLLNSMIGGLVAAITVLVVGIAVLADGESLVYRLRRMVPSSQRDRAVQVGRVFYRTIGAYFAGSLLVASLAATFVLTVGLALGVPLAPVAALWVLIVNFIPQIGGLLAASMFTLLALGKGPGTAVLCLALYVVYMYIENHVIQPAVVGNAVNLSTAATMLAALIGGAAGGVPGAIIATPLAGTVKALYAEIKYGPQLEQKKRVGLTRKIVSGLRAKFRS